MNKEPSPSILVLPGMHGSGAGHWQTAWERMLPDACRVPARDWDHPVCSDWVAALERAVAVTGPQVVLVAHSLGCLQVVRWAFATRLSVRGALLVAPPDPSAAAFPRQAVGFTPLPSMALPFASIVVASEDDPFATMSFSRRCAETWGSRLVAVGKLGHVNADSGLGDWAEGRRILRDLML